MPESIPDMDEPDVEAAADGVDRIPVGIPVDIPVDIGWPGIPDGPVELPPQAAAVRRTAQLRPAAARALRVRR
jgi:hypothetical protein